MPNRVRERATELIIVEVHQGHEAIFHGDELLHISLLRPLALRLWVAAEDDRDIQELGMVPHDLHEPLAAPRKAPANDGVFVHVGSVTKEVDKLHESWWHSGLETVWVYLHPGVPARKRAIDRQINLPHLRLAVFPLSLRPKAATTRHEEDDRQGRWVCACRHVYRRENETFVIIAEFKLPCLQTNRLIFGT